MTTVSIRTEHDRQRFVYELYQKAQRSSGYLLIGDRRKKKNGKQVIYAIPEPK